MPRTAVLVALALAAGCKRSGRPSVDTQVDAARAAAVPAATGRSTYDPSALVRGGANPVDVFLREPRNEAWARAAEDVLGAHMRRDLAAVVPEAKGVGLECRTLGCVIAVDAPPGRLPVAMDVVKLVTLGPVTVDLGVSEGGQGQVLFLMDSRMADPATFTEWYVNLHRRTVEGIRSGRTPNPLPVPTTTLPAP